MPGFLGHRCGSAPCKKVVNDDGSEYFTWMGLREGHCGDCEAMQIVAASLAGLTGAESMTPVADKKKD